MYEEQTEDTAQRKQVSRIQDENVSSIRANQT